MDAPKSYGTVLNSALGYVPVLIETTPEGLTQVSDKGSEHEDYVEAKREAVRMADKANVPFLRTID